MTAASWLASECCSNNNVCSDVFFLTPPVKIRWGRGGKRVPLRRRESREIRNSLLIFLEWVWFRPAESADERNFEKPKENEEKKKGGKEKKRKVVASIEASR